MGTSGRLGLDGRYRAEQPTVASSVRRSGRKPAARAFDALIAATAIANGLPLYTCNPEEFVGIADLVMRSVRVPDPR